MAGEAAHKVNDLPPAPHGDAGGRALPIVLWCLFAAFILCGAFIVLRACGTSFLFGFGRDFCPVVGDDEALRRERDTGETLRRQVHLAELDLLEKPICPLPQPPAPPIKPRPVPKPPVVTPSVDDIVKDRGGKTGKLQITLSWKTLDDLDLNLDCPGGRISSAANRRGPGICGDGVKDLDANGHLKEHVSTTPVENIFWTTDIPSGDYAIEVIEAYAKDERHDSTVPFDLQIRWNDQVKTCSGVVTSLARTVQRSDSEGIISGTYLTLTWTFGQPLPDCHFVTGTAHLKSGKR